ncbi:MAG: hypothetical protein WCA51_05705 [Dehalococcoidia bacterium]
MSDYGGQHKESNYEIISILAFDYEAAIEWEIKRRQIRNKILKDGRRMSFKNLGDHRRKQALPPFLSAANSIAGICAIFVISKRIKYLCSLPEQLRELAKYAALEGNWKANSLEHVIRIVHFVSLLIAGLSHPDQNVYWISDEDYLFANIPRSQDVTRLTSYFTSYYVKHPLGELGIGTTQIDESDLRLEDLAALPDLVAGALSEIATKIATTHNGYIPVRLAFPLPTKLSWKSKMLSDWLSDNTSKLKKR